jgi:hypothetical protein
MSDLLVWIALILIVGGVIAALGGHMWEETATLPRFFGKEVNENVGFKVMMAALTAVLAGFGLVYFLR